MTPAANSGVTEAELKPSRADFLRSCTVAVIQEAVLLGLGHLSANWPGTPVSPSGRLLTGLVLRGGVVALAYAGSLAALLLWFEFRVKSKNRSALESEDARRFSKLIVAPSVPTVAFTTLLLWVSNIVVLGLTVGKSGEDAAMFLLMGLTVGTIVWGTLTFAFGLFLRAVLIRLTRGR